MSDRIEIKLNSAEKMVLIDTLAKIQNLQDNIKKLADEIAESRNIEVKENVIWVLSHDYSTLIGDSKVEGDKNDDSGRDGS